MNRNAAKDVKVDFSGRGMRYTEEEIAIVAEVMRSAGTLTQGRRLEEFQDAFADFLDVPRGSCFAVMNGAAALELSAQLCLFEPGDEVIIPSHTFTASAYPYAKRGAKIVWADIDPATRVVSPDSIRAVITPRTRAIVAVHLYGYVADMPGIMKLAGERGILVIEDAAQSIGAGIGAPGAGPAGRRSGSFGDMAVFSFHSHKNVSTLGEGGMLVVRDRALAALVPSLRHNGHAAYPGPRPDYWIPAMGNVDMPELSGRQLWPNNYCLGEAECALGAALLRRIDGINAEKRVRALRFIDALADCPELVFHRVATSRHNYHLLAARVAGGGRDGLIRSLYGEHGVRCVVQYQPLNRYDFYVKIGLGAANCPHADAFYDSMISFPFQHWLSGEEFDHMLAATRKCLGAG